MRIPRLIAQFLAALFALTSCLAPRENALDPLKGGLMASLLLSFKPVVYAPDGSSVRVLDANSLAPLASLTTACMTTTSILADPAGTTLMMVSPTYVVCLRDPAQPTERTLMLSGFTGSTFLAYDDSTKTLLAVDSMGSTLVGIDVAAAAVRWSRSISTPSRSPTSLTAAGGQAIVSFANTTVAGYPVIIKACDARTGVDSRTWTSSYVPTVMTSQFSVRASPDERTLVSIEVDGSSFVMLRVHDATTLTPQNASNVAGVSINLARPFIDPVNRRIYVAEGLATDYYRAFDSDTLAYLGSIGSGAAITPGRLIYSRFLDRLFTVENSGVLAYNPRSRVQLSSVSGAYVDIVVVPGDRY